MTLCCHLTRHARKIWSDQRSSCPKRDRKILAPITVHMTHCYSKYDGLKRISYSERDYLRRRCFEYETESYEKDCLNEQTIINYDYTDDDNRYKALRPRKTSIVNIG